MNNLKKAPIKLLVEAKQQETAQDMFSVMSQHYDPRLNDAEMGPLYQIGPRYQLRERYFFQIQTFAGSLVARVVFDMKENKLGRTIIFTFGDASFEMLSPSSLGIPIEFTELVVAP
jgi:hypothetical protein